MKLDDITDLFEQVAVINLPRRRDRWLQFLYKLPADWPFHPPLRFPAIDGAQEQIPQWWQQGAGAWGCYLSHLAVIEHALKMGWESVLILEDDAAFSPGFALKVRAFLAEVPRDWRILYFGGQHLELDKKLPEKISDWVYRPYNVNRAHAYALRSRATLQEVYSHLQSPEEWDCLHHVDHRMGEYHKMYPEGIYVPKNWLVGQRGGASDICGKVLGFRSFLDSEKTTASHKSGD